MWLRAHDSAVLLIPLVSWAAPAHVPEGYLLEASIEQCHRRFDWRPDLIVGDLGYIHQETKRKIRQKWKVAVITKLKSDMNIVEPFDSMHELTCQHGQKLEWLEYDDNDQTHWFTVASDANLCRWCWDRSSCPRQFNYPASRSETLLGAVPLSTRPAIRLLKQVRSWIEPAQTYEKNQLGLKRMFLNSLRLTWTMTLLADAVSLLRATALLNHPDQHVFVLAELLPHQIELGL